MPFQLVPLESSASDIHAWCQGFIPLSSYEGRAIGERIVVHQPSRRVVPQVAASVVATRSETISHRAHTSLYPLSLFCFMLAPPLYPDADDGGPLRCKGIDHTGAEVSEPSWKCSADPAKTTYEIIRSTRRVRAQPPESTIPHDHAIDSEKRQAQFYLRHNNLLLMKIHRILKTWISGIAD